MNRSGILFSSFFFAGACAALAAACSSEARDNHFTDPDGAVSVDGGLGGNLGNESAPPCTGLECKQVTCSGGTTTTLKGTVYTPAKTNPDPIYNAILYVPNGELEPFAEGVSCEKCGTVTSGSPLVTALSDADGTFTLENVPAGEDIPLVIQVGRWRRKVVIPKVEACKDNKLDADLTRLPRNQQEGDIPLMAIVTSSYDKTECLMRKIGIDDSEFTPGSGSGRIHIYKGQGANLTGATDGTSLWGQPATLAKYDIVAFPCYSQPNDMPGRQNIVDYANSGGRVFITDLSEDIIKSGPAPWPSTANFSSTGSFVNPAKIDQTFPKGEALAKWLKEVGASTTLGDLELEDTYSRFSAVNGESQSWVLSSTPGNVQTYSFNTPVGEDVANQCGRVFYSSFHVTSVFGSGEIPSSCGTDMTLKPQEKALEFMLFDLAACIIKDGEKPIPPPVK